MEIYLKKKKRDEKASLGDSYSETSGGFRRCNSKCCNDYVSHTQIVDDNSDTQPEEYCYWIMYFQELPDLS